MRLSMKFAAMVAVVMAALVGGDGVKAQQTSGIWPDPAWCPTCFVASYADAPTAGSTITEDTVIWAWAGNCNDGSNPTQVVAVAAVNGGAQSIPVSFVFGGERPDVRAHLEAAGCNGGHTVVALWFPEGLPYGATAVSVRFMSSAIYAFATFSVSAEGGRQSGPFVADTSDFGVFATHSNGVRLGDTSASTYMYIESDTGDLVFKSGTAELLRLDGPQNRTTLTHTLSKREEAALDALIKDRAPLSVRTPMAVDGNGNSVLPDITVTPEMRAEWHATLIADALAPYLERIGRKEVEEAAADLKDLSAEECAALNKTRKQAGRPALKRCGGGL
jgi:hypothetical protein